MDEQLYKDVEGVFESVCEALATLHKMGSQTVFEKPIALKSLLELWDSICACWQNKPKPGTWINCLLKTVKLFPPESRKEAATAAEVTGPAQHQEFWVKSRIGKKETLLNCSSRLHGSKQSI